MWISTLTHHHTGKRHPHPRQRRDGVSRNVSRNRWILGATIELMESLARNIWTNGVPNTPTNSALVMDEASIATIREDLAIDYQTLADRHSEEIAQLLEEFSHSQSQSALELQEYEAERMWICQCVIDMYVNPYVLMGLSHKLIYLCSGSYNLFGRQCNLLFHIKTYRASISLCPEMCHWEEFCHQQYI